MVESTSGWNQTIRDALQRYSPKVLLWGSSASNPASTKRSQVKQYLISNGFKDTNLPEDLASHPKFLGVSPALQELVEVQLTDVIIAIDESEGVVAELAMISTVRKLRSKTLVMIPEKYRENVEKETTFIGSILAQFPKRHFYSPTDLEECNLTEVSLQFINRTGIIQFLKDNDFPNFA